MRIELAQKYWELGNTIVGFAVLQTIAFLSTLANAEFRGHVLDKFRLVISAYTVCSLSYSAAIIACYCMEISLRGEGLSDKVHGILFLTLLMRQVALAAATAFGLGILFWGRGLRENARPTPST